MAETMEEAGEMTTRLYAADVSELREERLYNAAYQKASDERRRKVDDMRFGRDRRLSLGVEMLLQYALGRAGLSRGDMAYRYGKDGKPYLLAETKLHFNLSHAGEIALCAVSPGEIGCDVERQTGLNMRIAERFFAGEEYRQLVQQESDKEMQELFFRLWTLKESFIKTSGLGLKIPLDSFCISFGRDGRPLPLLYEGRTYSFQEFTIHPDYKCSVCREEGCESQPVLLEQVRVSWNLPDRLTDAL